jgi:hypothetical protein
MQHFLGRNYLLTNKPHLYFSLKTAAFESVLHIQCGILVVDSY